MDKKHLEKSQDFRKKKAEWLKPNYNLPFDEFVSSMEMYRGPNSMGTHFNKRVIYDMNGMLVNVKSKRDRGDVSILNKVSMELKFSIRHIHSVPFEDENGPRKTSKYIHRLCNIRSWQTFDYFVIGLANPENNYNIVFYVVPKPIITENPSLKLYAQNNTKEANRDNKNIGMSVSLTQEMVEEYLVKYNILKDTTYTGMLAFLKSLYDKHSTKESELNSKFVPIKNIRQISETVSKPISTRVTNKRSSKTIVSFLIDGKTEISGNTNIEAMTNLIKHIGPDNAYGKMMKFWLSKEKSTYRTMKLGNYYFNPKSSIRDIRLNVNLLRKHGGIDIKIIETKKAKK